MGIVLATILGFILGVLRLSNNWIVTRWLVPTLKSCGIFRYRAVHLWQTAVFIIFLPKVRDPISIFDTIYIHNRGLPVRSQSARRAWICVLCDLRRDRRCMWLRKWRAGGRRNWSNFLFWTSLGSVGLPLLVASILGFPLSWEYAELGRFRFTGGMGIPIELFSALTALTIYTSAFIARSFVRAFSRSLADKQKRRMLWDWARSDLAARHIPQALRVINPPLISQYLISRKILRWAS